MKYNTKNKNYVRSFMKEHEDKHLSIEEISEGLWESARPVPLPSLYRIMDELVDEGIVRRYTIDRSSAACFQYAGDEAHNHFHLICSKCGKLIHLECDEVHRLLDHIEEEHGFAIDMTKVNLYGLCESCQKENKK